MKQRLTKKFVSMFLAVMMIVSSMPLTAFARDTGLAEADPYWTRVASSNFDATTGVNNATANSLYNLNESPVIKSGDSAMTWGVCDYSNASSSDGTGLYVDDGYIVLKGYNGSGTTPVTGKSNFKIDVELEWTAENSNANSQRYCTLQLANGTALGKTNATMGSSASNIIAQDYYGKVYIGTTGYGTDGTSNCISPYSANLTTGKKYHYIMTYANKTLKTYVTDENYTVMQDVCTVENIPINTSLINSICLGDDDSSYYFKNTKYHSITFYEGKTTSVNSVDTSKSKYLFAYFTGNASNDESLHLAVSNDGLQWKTLNKNFPVWNGTAATSIYPDNSGVAATTHIRDPYIMRAQDGSYYVFATDLDTQGGTNWGNNSKMHIFKANSLTAFKNNSVEHWEIDMQSIMANVLGGNTIRTWAPQAIYDPEYGQYMLYWSAATDSYGTTSMYYVYTTDFKNFTTTPKRLISPIGAGDNGDLNEANIDGDIYYNGQFYYLWYKNEATASLAVMTSESPSGPYTNLKAFSYSQALEGPQIYQLQNNKYILLADAYSNYCYRAFMSSTVDGFTASSEISNTNIDSLQPRHGAVIQIDDAEYNSLVDTFGIDANDGVVRYEFSLDHYNNSDGYTGKTWEGNQYNYDVGYKNDSNSYAQMGNGVAKLVGKNLFINDTNVRSIIQNTTFTFSFKFKLTQNVANKNPVIFATCSSAANNTDYVRLLEDGTFSVNGKDCTNKANIVPGEEHTYTIAYSGVDETAILLQDGNLVGAIATGSMDNTGAQFVGLGFSDAMSGEGRIYGEYSALTFQKTIPDAVKTILEENIVDTSLEEIHNAKGTITTGDVNAKTIEKFGKTGYFQTTQATNTPWSGVKGYNNILYSSQTVNSPGALDLGYLDWKVHMPNKYVLVYDGIDSNRPNFPIVLEAKWKDRWAFGTYWYEAKYCSVYSSVPFELPYKWKGGNTGWSATTVWNTAIGGSEEIGNSSSNQSSLKHTDTTPRFYANIMKYNGSGNNTDYYDKYSSIQYQMYSSWSSNTKQQTTTGDIYVLNYKPVRDIINGMVTPTVDGNTYTFKTLFNEVSNNEKKYTKESIIAYYNAVNDIMSLNVGNYFTNTTNDSNVEGQVTSAATAIKNAVNNYNTAVAGLTRQYKVTFKKAQADGGQAIKAIYVLGETAKKDSIIAVAPINTARWYDNTNHYDYSWTINNDVTTDIDIYENRTATAHSYTATTEADGSDRYKASTCTESGFYYNVCSCGYECLVNTNPLGHNYQSTVGSDDITKYKAPTCTVDGYHYMVCQTCNDTYIVIDGALDHDWGTGVSNGDGTHKQTCLRDSSHTQDLPCNMVENAEGTQATCSECRYTTTIVHLDRTAYNEALANANDVITNEKARYSAESLAALQAVLVQAGKDALAAKTQDELDAVTARIKSANSTDTATGGVLVANTFRITYGNMFSFDDFMNSDSKDCAPDTSGDVKGTISFDYANEVFTVTSISPYKDVYSKHSASGTYKIPVTAGKSYTFEYEVANSNLNQAFVFFYNENGNQIRLDPSYAFTETIDGVEKPRTASNGDYFINKYEAPVNKKVQLTFTAPETCTSVDFRFGVVKQTGTSASFYNIGFYESDMVQNFVLADEVVYGTAFDELAIMSPDIDGQHFGGWFVDDALTTSASTLTEITRNVNLYAKLDALKVKDVVGCTLLKHGYTTYVCSDENCSTDVVYTSYDDQILDGSAFFPANDAIQAIIDAEIANGYQNYTQASIEALASARQNLYNTTVNYHTQAEVDAAVTTMNNLVNNLVVKINFVTKTDGAVNSTQTMEVAYNGSLTAPTVNPYTTVDGRYTWTFSSWDTEVVTSNITTGATYTAQYTKTDNVDLSAYNAAVKFAEDSIANTAKYTEASRNALQDVLDNSAIDENTSQATVNNYITAIQTAITNLALMQYDVEFYYVLDNNDPVKCATGNATVDYGTEFELTAPSIEGNYSILKWTRTTYPNGEPKDETVGSSNETLKGRYTGTTKYYVYLKTIPAQQESTENANIYLTDRLGRVIDAMSVTLENGSATVDVSVSGSSITIGTVTMTAPSISFYTVSGFRFSMNNETVTNKQYTITADTYISVSYAPATSFTITCDTTCTPDKTTAQWDDKVTVTANNGSETTQWYVNGVLVGYGTKYVFRANQNVNITCKNETVELIPTAAVSRLSYNSPIDRTITVVGSFNLPDGYTLVETGVLLKTSAVNNTDAVNNADNYNLVNGNAKKFVATNYTKDTHQFTVNVYSSKLYTDIYLGAVAYLTYKDANGKENTVYSPLVNTTYSNGNNAQSSISQEVA